MTKEQEEVIEILRDKNCMWNNSENEILQAIETVLNLTQEQQIELKKKDKIINNAINTIEVIIQYFGDILQQADFILILEILKDSKVTDW